jgi:predicted Zn finger-like uncharacterized protein
MSSLLRVACPHCLARLKLKSRGMLGRRVTCPKCRETFDAVEEDEELFGPAESPPREPSPPMISRKTPRRMKRSNGVPAGLGWFVAGTALTAIVAAAFFVPWSSLVADINLNPFADTPDTIMALETPLLSELADLMEGVADGAPFPEATAKIKDIDGRMVDLYLRAVRVSPVSHERLNSFAEKHRAEVEDFENRSKAMNERGPAQRRKVTSPAEQQAFAGFQSTYGRLQFHLKILNRTINTVMERPPAQNSKMGRTEGEMIDCLREVLALLSRVDSNSAALTARSALENDKVRLDDLKRKAAEETTSTSREDILAALSSERFAESIRTEIAQVGEIVAERHSPGSDFQQAVAALAPFASLKMRGSSDTPAAGAPQRVARPRATIAPTRVAALAPTTVLPTGPVARLTPAAPPSQTDKEQIHEESLGPAIPPFVPPNTTANGFVAKCIREFGKEHVVFIGYADADIPARYVTQKLSQIQTDLGDVTTHSSNNKWTIIGIASSDDIEKIADKLHVGRVREIDADNRRIYVALEGVVRKPSPFVNGARPHHPPVLRHFPHFPRGNPTPPPSNLGPAPGPQPNGSKSSGI